MSKYGLSERHEFCGDWFLPPAEGAQPMPVNGTATWSRKGIEIQLDGLLDATTSLIESPGNASIKHGYESIFGTTADAGLVSILHAKKISSQLSFGLAGHRESQRLISSYCVISAHVTPATLYTEMRFLVPGLPLWCKDSAVTAALISSDQQPSLSSMVGIHAIDLPAVELTDEELIVAIQLSASISGFGAPSMTISSNGYVRLSSPSAKPMDWYFRQLGRVTTLLSFLIGAPVAPEQIDVRVERTNRLAKLLIAFSNGETCTWTDARQVFMPQSYLSGDLAKIMRTWFQISAAVTQPSQLALSVLNSTGLWTYIEFLSLMQALEGLHRARHSGLYVSRDAYKPIQDALTNAIPPSTSPDHRASLKSRIKFANEKSLGNRLKELVGALSEEVRIRILGGIGRMPQSWVDTRNYYTHWDETSATNVLEGIEMINAIARLKVLLRVLYLQLSGIPDPDLIKALEGYSDECQHLLQLNAEERASKS